MGEGESRGFEVMKIVAILVVFSLLFAVFVPTIHADTTSVLETKENFTLYTNTSDHPVGLIGSDVGYVLYANETLFVSWITTEPNNSFLYFPEPMVYLLTPKQRASYSQLLLGPPFLDGYLLKVVPDEWQGNFSYTVPQNGTYYVVLQNLNWGALDLEGPTFNIQFYEATVTSPSPTPNPNPTPQTQTVGGTSFRVNALPTSKFARSILWASIASLMMIIALTLLVVCARRKLHRTHDN
jgi:hypothetical protein